MHHLILYDGVCGLCNRFVRFALERDRAGVFRFAPLQGDQAREILERHGESSDLSTLYVVVDAGTDGERLLQRSRAALFVIGQLPTGWRWLRVFGILPTFLLDLGYRCMAKIRYRVFGRLPDCAVPPPEHRDRFL